ncbi:MAG: glycosyltransferase family 4 protein [Desulfobacteraceae bacterium]
MGEQRLALYLFSLVCGTAGAWFCVRFGTIAGFMDTPSHRSSHALPTPRGGGIGLLAAFVAAALALKIDTGFWLPVAAVSVVGLMDDRKAMAPLLRLCLQTAAASVLVAVGLPLVWGGYHPGSVVLWVVFVIGTTNCYNFMDGINGISGLTASALFILCWFFLRTTGGNLSLAALVLSLVFACAGFLPFNFPRARVFMGDCGSLLLGFLFGGVVLVSVRSFGDFLLFTAFLFPFYADSFTTMIIRVKNGENLFTAHRSHLYQLLTNEAGISHWKVSLGYLVVQLVTGGVGYFLYITGEGALPFFLAFCLLLFVSLSCLVRQRMAQCRV